MTMLTCVQDFCERQGIPSPATVYGTTDAQVKQVRALLEDAGVELAKRGNWQALTFEATHTTLALEDQGAIATIATNGFRKIKNETIWDRTDKLPVLGPLTDRDWQAVKAYAVSGPRYRYRIRGGKLLVNPVPTAGHTWAFEYYSKYWILGANGTTYKERFTLDTDTILLPENLLIKGLTWRWLEKKGQDYAEAFREYEMNVKDELGQDGGKPVLCMDEPSRMGQPGIFVPDRNWSL